MFFIKSLRAKTLLAVLIPMALVLVAAAIILLYAYERVTQDVVKQRDTELARISAARLSESLSRYSKVLRSTAAEEDVQSLEPDRLISGLEKAQNHLYLFDGGVVVYNSEGVALWSQPFAAERQGRDFPIASKFDEMRQTLRPAFSDIFKDAVTGEDVILVGVPILKSDGEFKGVLAGMATVRHSLLGAMCAKLLEFKAGGSGYAYLVDGNGRVIYHRHSSQVGRSLTTTVPVMQATRGETDAVITQDSTGETVISGFAPVPGTSWAVITQERWENIIGPIRGYTNLLLGLLVVGGVISGALIFFGTGRILKPIKDLTTGAERIAGGQFDYTIAAKNGDEIQTLAQQFNCMARALKDSYANLEQHVRERTAELQVANIRLKELDRLKSMFIASMSHELRTPLNSIMGFTGIILQGMAGELNEEQRRQLTRVKNSAIHLLALINDIIDASKIEAGKVELLIEEFDLSVLVREVENSFKIAAEEKSLKMSLEMPKRLTIKNDERRTKQVLVNLVGNAIKFTDRGKIQIKVVKKDRRVEVSVKDTGIGIRNEEMARLFKAFSQISNQGRPKQEGTGIGLYLSKKILDLLGGEIKAESEFGKGSLFTFTLPLKYERVKGGLMG